MVMVSGLASFYQMFRVESLDNGIHVINKSAEVENVWTMKRSGGYQ